MPISPNHLQRCLPLRIVGRTLPALAMLVAAMPLSAQAAPSWTDWADLVLQSPVILVAAIDKPQILSRKLAPDVPPGQVRALVEAQLSTVLRAPGILPARAEWLWQGAPDMKGRPPFAKGAAVIVFAAQADSSPDPEIQQFRLTSPRGMQAWSVGAEATIRAILAEAVQPENAGLEVTAVSDGFHSAGVEDGRSESQFFLTSESGKPMTLLVARAPGLAPAIRLATGEVIDRATEIRPRTLRWRALACGLPAALPERLGAEPALRADYAAVLESLGTCGRTAG